jgi:hypothetical protein
VSELPFVIACIACVPVGMALAEAWGRRRADNRDLEARVARLESDMLDVRYRVSDVEEDYDDEEIDEDDEDEDEDDPEVERLRAEVDELKLQLRAERGGLR